MIGERRLGTSQRRPLAGEDALTGEPRIGVRGGRERPPAFDPHQWAHDWTYRARFTFVIPGQHYSGLSNEDLRAVFVRNRRDFFADSRDLRDHVAERVADAVEKRGHGNDLYARQIARNAYREWIVWRFEHQGPDVTLRPLSAEWAKQKRQEGADPRIGIRRGSWLRAVSRGRTEIETE